MLTFLFYFINKVTGISFFFFIYFFLLVLFFIFYIFFYNLYSSIFLLFFIIFFIFYVLLCMFFHLYLSYLSFREPIIRITANSTFILYLDINKIVKTENELSVYIFNTKKKYKYLDKRIKMLNDLLYKKKKSINIQLLSQICNNPYRFFLLLSHFDFFFVSFYFFYIIKRLLHTSKNSAFLYKSNKLEKLKNIMLKQYIKQEKAYFFVRYIFYQYYSIICSNLIKKEKLYKLNKKLNFFLSIYAISKQKDLDVVYLYFNPLKLKKKHFLLFCNRFFFINQIRPRLLNKYLSMLTAQKIHHI